ncbi:ATP-binding protein [Croceibacterium sp. TMG7-5b_MA50]|uniref:ATP-binding protein n=1 Tax=Croceibacterium sp. TMG7-5b_MA50 TaxID=3121290 RepID=UPI00322198CB
MATATPSPGSEQGLRTLFGMLPTTPADAGRRNLLLLIQLRWFAVGGQLVTIEIVRSAMGIALPVGPLLGAVLLLVAINLASLPLLQRRRDVSNRELTLALLLDVGVLAWQLHFTGGIANPFAPLFLLQVVLGALLLSQQAAWGVAVVALGALLAQLLWTRPLNLPAPYAADPLQLYLQGSFVCFALIAVLLLVFVTRTTRNLNQRNAALAEVQQRAVEEDHIVRMGLLASGAAHELGTPLASLSVLIGDWRRLPQLARDRELQEDLADMDTAVQRCKAIVSSILLAAGEARGLAPERTSVRAFLHAIVAEWRSGATGRMPGEFAFTDHFGEPDVPIIADPALRQVIGNVIDNAVEASPDWVGLTALRLGDRLVLEVADRGPGFDPTMLQAFGRPYHSTKGRAGGGVGLFLLVNVLRQLGGTVAARNNPEGGATVRVEIPLNALTSASDA